MSQLVISIDLDWACEAAIEQTLDFFLTRNMPTAVFATHHSAALNERLDDLIVGLHPFFGTGSSHGNTINEVVNTIMEIPHNLPAFRCHRFESSNESINAMKDAGMELVSNVCTDCMVVPPFKHRSGLFEFPIFIEDGGYLWQQRALTHISDDIAYHLSQPTVKFLLIHPMHFVINTPYFDYMVNIKQSLSRTAWQTMSKDMIASLAHPGIGMRNFIQALLDHNQQVIGLDQWYTQVRAQHNPQQQKLQWQNQNDSTQGNN